MALTMKFDFRKALAALLYLAAQGKRVAPFDKYKAVKLLFLAEKHHLARFARPIFGDYYRALPWGPVPQTVLDILHDVEDARLRTKEAQTTAEYLAVGTVKGHGYPCFFPKKPAKVERALAPSALNILAEVVEKYGGMSFEDLYNLTHKMPAYTRAWKQRGDAQAVQMRIEDFFDEEAPRGALAELIETHQVRTALSGST